MKTVESALIGQECESVCFIGTYSILGFGDGSITAYLWPKVSSDGAYSAFGDRGYPDKLCALIGTEYKRRQRRSWH